MRYFGIVFFIVFSISPLQAEDISSHDFATGIYLDVDGKNAMYSLELPEEVYRTVKSANLSDLRVFNSAGEVVPHELRTVKTDPETLRDKVTIPFFPLFGASAASEQTEFSFQIARDSGGAIVNILPDSKVDRRDQRVTGYLLDVSGFHKTVSGLEFFWNKDIDSSVYTVRLQQSNDLIRWKPLVYRATLADLQFAGQQVKQREVFLPGQAQKFLKLTWLDSNQPLELTGVSGISKIIKARRKHRWVLLNNGTTQVADDQLMVDFTTSYQLTTSSVQMGFTETNSIAKLSIQSRPDEDTGWKTRCEQVFYDLSIDGTVIRNEPCYFPSTADSLWRVVVKQDGAGLASENKMVTLQLGWQPSELLFVGRGAPPYLLAFGSGKLKQLDSNSHDGMLMQTIKEGASAKIVGQAQVGKRITLGGKLALQIPTEPTPWKKWLLWTVLIFGVGLLAFMARKLIKELKKGE